MARVSSGHEPLTVALIRAMIREIPMAGKIFGMQVKGSLSAAVWDH